jgi:hypothetical protein
MKTAYSRRIVFVLGALLLLSAVSPGMTLVKDGEPACVIVTSNNPFPSQQVAAEELQHHLKLMSGAEVPIVREADLQETDGIVILVGQSDRLKALGIDTTMLAPESILVKTAGQVLVLAGEDGGTVDPYTVEYDSSSVRQGTLYAVYDFLQDQLGCRWLWPGEFGESIPWRPTVEIGDLDIQETPKLFRRHFRLSLTDGLRAEQEEYAPRYFAANKALWDSMSKEERQWVKRMRLGQSTGFAYGHAFTDWLDKHGKDHPEYFALQEDGSRGLPKVTYPRGYVKLCISNPKVIDRIIENFETARAADPTLRFLNACENDGSWGFCRCEQCAAWDKPLTDELRQHYRDTGWTDEQIDKTFGPSEKDGQPGSLSNRYFTFYNDLARRVAKIAPDAWVVAYAYARYRFAPIDLKLEPNLFIGFIGFNFYPMTPQQHRFEIENFLAWREAGAKQLFFRPNSLYYSPAHGIPWSAAHEMGEDMKLLIDNGIVSTDFDRETGQWATAGPTYYVLARLQWDPEMSVDDILSEFYEGFGPAAEDVREYFGLWEDAFIEAYARPDLDQIVKQILPEGGRIGRRRAIAVLLNEEQFDRAAEILVRAREKAARAAGDGPLNRVVILERGLRHGRALWKVSQFANTIRQDQDTYYEDGFPLIQSLFAARGNLADFHAQNVFWLAYFEVYSQDMYGTRVYHDFYRRTYNPVMTPAEASWTFLPDPEDAVEAAGAMNELPAPPECMKREEGDRLFFRDWDTYRPVIAWKDATKSPSVVNGWYQVDFNVPAERIKPTNVLYIPCILGRSAKIWIDGRLVREVSKEEIDAGEPIVIGQEEAGIEPGRAFRLTIKVSSPDGPGGLIGPAYLARSIYDTQVIRK